MSTNNDSTVPFVATHEIRVWNEEGRLDTIRVMMRGVSLYTKAEWESGGASAWRISPRGFEYKGGVATAWHDVRAVDPGHVTTRLALWRVAPAEDSGDFAAAGNEATNWFGSEEAATAAAARVAEALGGEWVAVDVTEGFGKLGRSLRKAALYEAVASLTVASDAPTKTPVTSSGWYVCTDETLAKIVWGGRTNDPRVVARVASSVDADRYTRLSEELAMVI